jgi:hypothetical protein
VEVGRLSNEKMEVIWGNNKYLKPRPKDELGPKTNYQLLILTRKSLHTRWERPMEGYLAADEVD